MWQNGEMTGIQNTIITPKVTSLNIIMIVKSRIDTLQPACLTNKQTSISEHRSLTAARYFKAFTEHAGIPQKLPLWLFRRHNSPNKILRNSLSLTVPAGIFKPSIQRTVYVFTSENQLTISWLQKAAWITSWRLPPPVWYWLRSSCVIIVH